jgi:hypothetical protein
MSDAAAFSTAAVSARPDPDKRVRYSLGQVLGADDFEQEQFHVLNRGRQHNRSLHGYGTVSGLGLRLEGSELRVGPGLALTPAGCVVGVPAAQCADAAAWIGANLDALRPPVDDAGTRLVHVVLGYRECDSDALPLPVTPCCGEGEGVATRITETFRLAFRVDPPAAAEEAAVGRFGRLLRGLRAAPADGTPLDLPALADRVRALLTGEAAGPWVVPAGQLDAAFGTAFRTWITELRPQLHPGPNPPLPDAEDGVLLGTLRFRLEGATLQPDSLVLDETSRPLLLSTRTLQELRGSGAGPGAAAEAPLPAETVQPEQSFDLLPNAGNATAYARADHTHGTPSLPGLDGDVRGALADNVVAALQGRRLDAASPNDGDVLGFDAAGNRWVPRPPPDAGGGGGPVITPLNGDAAGPANANTVRALQGRDVADADPDNGDVLTWSADAKAWLPRAPAAAPGGGPVRIVAGGMLGMNGAQGLVLGGLELLDRAPFLFSFEGYSRPRQGSGHNYIVKALAVVKEGSAVPVIGFAGFQDRGILLTIGLGDRPRGFDDDMSIMVEVTEIRAADVPLRPRAAAPAAAARKTRGRS